MRRVKTNQKNLEVFFAFPFFATVSNQLAIKNDFLFLFIFWKKVTLKHGEMQKKWLAFISVYIFKGYGRFWLTFRRVHFL